jgi:hypothetical protein
VDFIKEYMAARKLAFLPETIMKAWARCGICPLNPKIFSDADFAPSASTSTKGHVLTSYPAKFYGEESDLDRDENEDEDAHDGDTCNEDRELDDNDDDGSDSSVLHGYGFTRGFRAGFTTGTGRGTRICTRRKPVPVICTRHICSCLPPNSLFWEIIVKLFSCLPVSFTHHAYDM